MQGFDRCVAPAFPPVRTVRNTRSQWRQGNARKRHRLPCLERNPQAAPFAHFCLFLSGQTSEVKMASFATQAVTPLRDAYQRPITDLRVAITDRCNYKCV